MEMLAQCSDGCWLVYGGLRLGPDWPRPPWKKRQYKIQERLSVQFSVRWSGGRRSNVVVWLSGRSMAGYCSLRYHHCITMDESFPRGPYTFRNQDSERRIAGIGHRAGHSRLNNVIYETRWRTVVYTPTSLKLTVLTPLQGYGVTSIQGTVHREEEPSILERDILDCTFSRMPTEPGRTGHFWLETDSCSHQSQLLKKCIYT